MLNLIKVELKTNLLKRIPILTLFIGVFSGLSIGKINQIMGSSMLAGRDLLLNIYLVFFISAVMPSIFIIRDFSSNTIRNKLVVGNSRSDVFFSKFIISLIYCLLLYFISFVFVYLSQKIYLGISENEILLLLYLFVTCIGISVFQAGFIVLISFIIKKTYTIFLICILSFVSMIVIDLVTSSLFEVLLPFDSYLDSCITLSIMGFIMCLIGYLNFSNANLN